MQKMPSRCKACPMVVLPAQLLLHPVTSLGQRPFHDINGNEKRKVLKSSRGCKAPGSSPGDKEKGWQACTLPVIVRTLGSSKRVFACSLDFNSRGCLAQQHPCRSDLRLNCQQLELLASDCGTHYPLLWKEANVLLSVVEHDQPLRCCQMLRT